MVQFTKYKIAVSPENIQQALQKESVKFFVIQMSGFWKKVL